MDQRRTDPGSRCESVLAVGAFATRAEVDQWNTQSGFERFRGCIFAITCFQTEDEPQRYDFRDTTEGGNIILWLNDIENDPMYEGWPSELRAVSTTINYIDFELIVIAAAAKNLPWPAPVLSKGHSQRHRLR